MPSVEPPPHCLLLDLDGTLADSLHAMRAAYAAFLCRFGKPASDGEFASLNGPPLAEVVRRLQQTHHLPGRLEELIAAYQSVIDAVYADVPAMPGARELLSAVRVQGWKVGVVTSNSGRRARQWLERTGLGPLVDFIVAGEDAPRGKPYPDPYLLALARSGCGRESAIAVEDSPQGVAAALAAGLITYALQPADASESSWPKEAGRLARLEDLIPLLAKPAAR